MPRCCSPLDNGANVNHREATALIEAADVGQLEAVRLLLDRGANVNAVTRRGWDALMFAAGRGYLEIVKLLLDSGCGVDASDNETGWTALMWARKAGHLEIANLLQARSTSVAPSTA